jgi:hypothetical protein
MKKIISIWLIAVIFLSCSKNDGKKDITILKQEVAKNKNFSAYQNALNAITLSGLSQEISLKNVDKKMIKSQLSNVRNLEDLKALYSKAGVVNGDKLAELQYAYNTSLLALMKEVPDLKELDRKDLHEVLKIKAEFTKEDVAKSANRILEGNN